MKLQEKNKQNIRLKIPEDACRILSMLEEEGCQAYVVGGCVRDSLIGRTPGDWDITTSALPLQVKSLFKRTIDTGIKHGTVTVMMGKTGYEVTTYRVDGEYVDGRHPEFVEFTVNLVDDLMRRDFTINAMAYNLSAGLVDEFDGIGDLEREIIRCVGNPEERFEEDALRMMRAIRFSAQLGFTIEQRTYDAICKLSGNIVKVSMERVHDELNKTLLSDHPDYVVQMAETGLFAENLPVLNGILKDKKCIATKKLLQNSEKDLVLRYAALLGSVTPEQANETLRALKLDNATIGTVTKLVKLAKVGIEETEPAMREAIHMYGREFIPLLLRYRRTIVHSKEQTTGIVMPGSSKHLDVLERLYQEISQRGDCISIKDLDINGKDLMELGITGPRIGETLNSLLYIVMENPRLNEKATLIALIENQ